MAKSISIKSYEKMQPTYTKYKGYVIEKNNFPKHHPLGNVAKYAKYSAWLGKELVAQAKTLSVIKSKLNRRIAEYGK